MNRFEEPATPPGGAHLTSLETSWTNIRNAHLPGLEGEVAMRDLVGRYHDAVKHYLRLKLRDPHLADEVLQEFWVKLLNHKMAGADSNKGRFRDYLRTVLHRIIIDHFRGKKLQALPLGDLPDSNLVDQEYDRIWREAVIRRVWARLETYEVRTPKNRYATVLHLRVDHPKASIEEIATILGDRYQTRVSPEAFRKTLQRARAKFLELLVEELRLTIHPASDEEIEAEINDLGLAQLYRRLSQSGHD